MKSDLDDLIGAPLPLALEQAALRGLRLSVVDTRSPSKRSDSGERLPRVIAVRGDHLLVGYFLDALPEGNAHG